MYEELHTIHDKVWNGFKSTTQTLFVGHENWSQDTFEMWFEGGFLPQLLRKTWQGYQALLVEGERLCLGGVWTDEVETYFGHHSDRMGSIRRIGCPTRLQLPIRMYIYLRDARRNKFTCASLQQKQARAVRNKLEALEARLSSQPRNSPRPGGGVGGRGGGNNEDGFRCSRCNSKNVHPGTGGQNCPFKGFRYKISKLIGKTANKLMGEGKSKNDVIEEALETHRAEDT